MTEQSPTAAPAQDAQNYRFQAEVDRLLHLVVNSLYSHKEIFLRELVSNASDALDKLKFRSLTEPELMADTPLRIRLIPNSKDNTLTIDDTGIGMTREELISDLGTIAKSGTRDFLDRLTQSGQDATGLIGQFGVGFYSAYLVADEVTVISKAAGSTGHAWVWKSDGVGGFSVAPADRDIRGTAIVLHLKEDQREYLQSWKLKDLIKRYSDFVSFPIELVETKEKDGESTESIETVNRANALWLRSKNDITDDEYKEFYRHLVHDWEDPVSWTHFRIEGTQLFSGLLYIPKRPPFDLWMREQKHGVRLYVQRVFIMDDCEALLPQWMRFVRGVVDSNDLPLNVSRELLQDSSVTRTIKKQVTKKVLEMFEELAEKRPEDYTATWNSYGPVIKEGFHFSPEHREKLSDLVRYHSSAGDDLTSLADYVSRMKEDQSAIYYIVGENRRALQQSPHIEALKAKGYEILFMIDPVDEWVQEGLTEYKGKPLVSAMKADLTLSTSEGDKKKAEGQKQSFSSLVEHLSKLLGDRVESVHLSERLTDSPACLAVPEGGLSAHMEKILRAHQKDLPVTKRVFEINPDHAIVDNLRRLHEREPDSARVAEWAELLYDQALIAEGSPLSDPAAFTRRVNSLLHQATTAAVFG
ncbi:MAG: molecular chaperone HtpG [Myxococcales bacterium]|nr:molecular chaperone HtpG [Myxococcales bacterium]